MRFWAQNRVQTNDHITLKCYKLREDENNMKQYYWLNKSEILT